jgi:TRAP-type uncharacterized transport system substrate-binding protein
MTEKPITKEDLLYIVSYEDASRKFTAIKNEAIDKLTELVETIISLFPNAEIDSKTYRNLVDRISKTIEFLKKGA